MQIPILNARSLQICENGRHGAVVIGQRLFRRFRLLDDGHGHDRHVGCKPRFALAGNDDRGLAGPLLRHSRHG